jgi:amphi-Trp domain-containing protein
MSERTMADTTSHASEMSRDEAASYLRSIAKQLESENTNVTVPIGNKNVRLSPPDGVDASMVVTERSRRLRKDTEQLEISFKWNPEKGDGSSASGSKSGD